MACKPSVAPGHPHDPGPGGGGREAGSLTSSIKDLGYHAAYFWHLVIVKLKRAAGRSGLLTQAALAEPVPVVAGSRPAARTPRSACGSRHSHAAAPLDSSPSCLPPLSAALSQPAMSSSCLGPEQCGWGSGERNCSLWGRPEDRSHRASAKASTSLVIQSLPPSGRGLIYPCVKLTSSRGAVSLLE